MPDVEEHLPSRSEDMNSNPSTTTIKKTKSKKTKIPLQTPHMTKKKISLYNII
jgi:hypothetical protein